MTHTIDTVPDADYFMKSMEGTVGSDLSISQLNMHELNHQFIDEWIGAYPEEEIDSIIQVKEAMNSTPQDQLQIENTHWTAE